MKTLFLQRFVDLQALLLRKSCRCLPFLLDRPLCLKTHLLQFLARFAPLFLV
ncbi:hypothetical protein D3C73_1673310 [compost metagenome]